MSAIELIYDFFEDHVRASMQVIERRPIALGMLGFALGGLSVFMAQALTGRLSLLSFSWPSFGIVIGWKIIAGFVLAAVLHLILDLQGIKGNVAALFILFGLADLAWALALPLVLVFRVVLSSSNLPATIVFFGTGLLVLSLKARSIQDVYRVGSGKAWFTLGLPYLGAILGSMLLFGLLMLKLILELVKAID